MNEGRMLRRLPLSTAAKLTGAILAVAALLALVALLFGAPFSIPTLRSGDAPKDAPVDGATVTESVDAPPVTLSEALVAIDRGNVMYINVRPDSYPDGARRWYGELESDGSLNSRWRVDGRDVLIDGIPILSADGQSVGLTEDEWAKLLQRVSAHNQIASVKITVIDDMESFGTGRPPEEYTP